MAVRPLRFSFVNFIANPDNARKTLSHRKEVDNNVGLWRNAKFGSKLELTPLSQPQRSADSSVRLSAAWPASVTRETSILWCIIAVTAVVYFRCLSSTFVLDDVAMFVRNPDLRHWSFLWKAFTREEFWYSDAGFFEIQHIRNYRPVFLVWCWIDYQLFGLNPAPWHASIVAVHLMAVWLVFKIMRRLAGDSTSALLAASAFALTPVHAAAVVWMAGSCYALGTAFALAAFYFVITARGAGAARNWAAAIALYGGALLCHECMTSFPALVAAYAFLFNPADSQPGEGVESSGASIWTRGWRAAMWTAPFAVELLIYFVVRKLVLGFFVNDPYYLQNLFTDAQEVLTIPLVLGTYLTLLVMPWRTMPNDRVFPVSSAVSPEFWLPLGAVVLIVAAFLVLATRLPRRRLYLFCAAWMAITLAPMMMLHSMPKVVQAYYLYLPSVGFCMVMGDVIASVALQNGLARRFVLGAACAMFVVYAVALWRVEGYWHDDVAAARGYIEGFPESVNWHWALAGRLEQRGDLAQAEQELRTAISLEPDRTGIFHPHSSALHHFLGELLAERGDIDGAVLEIGKSVNDPPDEDEQNPARSPYKYDKTGADLYSRGIYDAKQGNTDLGIREMRKGLEMMKRLPVPDYGPLAMRYIKLAELYDSIGNQEQVEAVLKEVDSMSEGELAAGLARAGIRRNHSDKAGAERILRELSENYPHNYEVLVELGDLQAELGQHQEALISYQRAAAGWIASPQLHVSLAKTLLALGRGHEAVDQCRLGEAMVPRNWAVKFSCAEVRSAIENK